MTATILTITVPGKDASTNPPSNTVADPATMTTPAKPPPPKHIHAVAGPLKYPHPLVLLSPTSQRIKPKRLLHSRCAINRSSRVHQLNQLRKISPPPAPPPHLAGHTPTCAFLFLQTLTLTCPHRTLPQLPLELALNLNLQPQLKPKYKLDI